MSVRAGGRRYKCVPYGRPRADYIIAPKAGRILATGLEVKRIKAVSTHQKMRRLGIETGADLRAKPFAFLQQHFGKSATWYLAIANGDDDRPVVADRQRKSSGSETTFARDLTALDEIEAGVVAKADDVWAWCEKTGAFGRTVTVKVKFADFHQVTRSRSFPSSRSRATISCGRQALNSCARSCRLPKGSGSSASPCRISIGRRPVPLVIFRCSAPARLLCRNLLQRQVSSDGAPCW